MLHDPLQAASVHRAELLAAFSYALDITEGQPEGHCIRSCWIGTEVGRALGLSDRDLGELYYTVLLKDLGCSSNAARICELYDADDRAFKQGYKTVGTSLAATLHFVFSKTARGKPLHRRAARDRQYPDQRRRHCPGADPVALHARRGYRPLAEISRKRVRGHLPARRALGRIGPAGTASVAATSRSTRGSRCSRRSPTCFTATPGAPPASTKSAAGPASGSTRTWSPRSSASPREDRLLGHADLADAAGDGGGAGAGR